MPAAAVKRGGQALLSITGRKGFVDGNASYLLNFKLEFYLAFKTVLL